MRRQGLSVLPYRMQRQPPRRRDAETDAEKKTGHSGLFFSSCLCASASRRLPFVFSRERKDPGGVAAAGPAGGRARGCSRGRTTSAGTKSLFHFSRHRSSSAAGAACPSRNAALHPNPLPWVQGRGGRSGSRFLRIRALYASRQSAARVRTLAAWASRPSASARAMMAAASRVRPWGS